MNEQYVAIRLIHEHLLGRTLSTEDFDSRITAQKIVYLASSQGLDFGDLNFNWYKRGPYSPALTRVLYENNFNQAVYSDYRLLEEAVELMKPLKAMIELRIPTMSEVEWLELLASVHFLMEENETEEQLVEQLRKYKPRYSRAEVLYAYKCLKE